MSSYWGMDPARINEAAVDQILTEKDKGHRFYRPDPSRDIYECASCGMGGFTVQRILARDFFPCSHYLER